MDRQIRISKINIETPRIGDEIWIHLTTQEVDWNPEHTEIENVTPRLNYIHKQASKTATDLLKVYDPVLQKEITLSGYGLHLAIEQMAMNWVCESLGKSLDSEGKLWL